MLYQNGIITWPLFSSADNAEQYNNLIIPGGSLPADQAQAGQKSDASKVRVNSEFDVTIFGSDKFKALKDNVVIPREDAGVGKKDPFQPN